MRIDSHHHFWNPHERDYYWMAGVDFDPIRKPYGPDDMLPLLQSASMDGSVVVQTVPSVSETESMLETAASVDFVKGVVGWVDLVAPDVDEVIARLRENKGGSRLVGIRHQAHDEDDKSWLARKDAIRGIRACGAAGLIYDLLAKEPELPAAIQCVDAAPEVSFVIDHISKPRIALGEMEPWLALMTELSRRPNVTCKLSGMVTEANWHSWDVGDLRPYVDTVLTLFGTERVMFGSDWPVCLLAAEYSRVVSSAEELCAHLAAEERASIFGRTANRVYGLGM